MNSFSAACTGPRRTFAARLSCVLLTLTVLLVAACSSDAHDKSTATDNGRKTGSDTVIHFALDAYFPTQSQDEAEDRAEYVLLSRCAEKYGIKLIKYPGPPDPGTPALTFQAQYINNLRPITVADATAFGYQQGRVGPGPLMGDDSPGVTDKQKSPYDGLSTDERLIVGGYEPILFPGTKKPNNPFVLHGGCAGLADREIRGPKASFDGSIDPKNVDYNYVSGLIYDSTARAQANPKFIAVEQRWASCLARNGHPGINTVLAAVKHFDLNAPTTKEQTATAIADAKCKIEVGMVTLWVHLVKANQAEIIDQDALQLAGVQQRTQQRARAAAAVLAR